MTFYLDPSRACGACSRLLLTASASGLCRTCVEDCTEIVHDRASKANALFTYEGPLKTPLARLKYNRDFGIARLFANLLAPRIASLPVRRKLVIIPVPMSLPRRLRRGCNHTELIAQWLPLDTLGVTLLPRGMFTRLHRPAQVGLSRAQRRHNTSGAFLLKSRSDRPLRGASVLILDDVISTGSTLRGCFEALDASGAEDIEGLALLRRVA